MSIILENKNNLESLKRYICYLKEYSIDENLIKEIIDFLIPTINNEKTASYTVKYNGIKAAIYNTKYKNINISLYKLEKVIERELIDYKVRDLDSLKAYLIMFALLHEIAHLYQHLISEGKINSPKIVALSYKELIKIVTKSDSIIPRPITDTLKFIRHLIYSKNQFYYLLERNANIEAFELINTVAKELNDTECVLQFEDLYNLCNIIGYKNNYNGSIEETFNKLFMRNKYQNLYNKFNEQMDTSDRVRYGLDIDHKTKIELLKKI